MAAEQPGHETAIESERAKAKSFHFAGPGAAPQHGAAASATHGVLRVALELEGEKVLKATPDLGYLHRGVEKLAEDETYNQIIPHTDRLDYICSMTNNFAYVRAVEKLLDPKSRNVRNISGQLLPRRSGSAGHLSGSEHRRSTSAR